MFLTISPRKVIAAVRALIFTEFASGSCIPFILELTLVLEFNPSPNAADLVSTNLATL